MKIRAQENSSKKPQNFASDSHRIDGAREEHTRKSKSQGSSTKVVKLRDYTAYRGGGCTQVLTPAADIGILYEK